MRYLVMLCVLIALTMSGEHQSTHGLSLTPAAGPKIKISVGATFREATLNRVREDKRNAKGEFDLTFPALATPPKVTVCKGLSVTSRRCLTQTVGPDGRLALGFPPSPLGVPARLEKTWMEVVYF